MYFTISRDNRQVISSRKKVPDVDPKKAAIDERWNHKITTLIRVLSASYGTIYF
jgi:hypothetical protein